VLNEQDSEFSVQGLGCSLVRRTWGLGFRDQCLGCIVQGAYLGQNKFSGPPITTGSAHCKLFPHAADNVIGMSSSASTSPTAADVAAEAVGALPCRTQLPLDDTARGVTITPRRQ